MERILVAVDFSDASRRALRSAVELSRAFGGELRVVHVLPALSYDKQHAALGLTRGAGDLERQHGLHELVAGELRGDQEELAAVSQKLLEGIEHEEILQDAARWGASLIVVGSHDRSVFGRLFSGSVSSRIVSRAPLPVLMVHSVGSLKPSRILAAVDGGESSGGVIESATSWAATLGAQLTLIHVAQHQAELRLKQIREDLETQLIAHASGKPLPRVEYRVGTPDREICTYAAETGQDLLIVGAHVKRGMLDFGNTAARVAHHCPCSVLVARSGGPGART